MFVRLTKTKRLKAGWAFALVYLLCVVAPSVSFAFANVVPHCLTLASLGISSAQMHGSMQMQGVAGAEHLHGGAMHDHSGMQTQSMFAGENVVLGAAVKDVSAPAKAPHKSSDAQCCGLMCLTALPASLVDIVTPPVLTFIRAPDPHRDVAENAPDRHYRPPIS